MTPKYRLALRAFPAGYRLEHGDELVQTATDLHPNGWSPRESAALMSTGLRTRARLATGGSAQQATASGIRLALLLTYIMTLVFRVVSRLGSAPHITLDGTTAFLLAPIIPIAVLTRTTRWPAALLITAFEMLSLMDQFRHQILGIAGYLLTAVTSTGVVVLLAWWLALRGDGRRAASPLATIALTVVISITTLVDQHRFLGPLTVVLGLVGIGVCVMLLDPRPLIAGSVFCLIIFASEAPMWAMGQRRVLIVGLVITTGLLALSRRSARRLETSPL
jgi:hypothetical protein